MTRTRADAAPQGEVAPSSVRSPVPETRRAHPHTVATVVATRTSGDRRRRVVLGVLCLAVVVLLGVTLMVGHTFYSPSEVLGVILGQDVGGASFTVGRLRLPRAGMALVTGLAFGMGGVTFQTMLRNPLASPDIIGISSGASAAAMVAIVVLGLSGPGLTLFAILAGLGVALAVYLLSYKGGVAGTRLILVGIGIAAMLDSLISYLLDQAPDWDLQEAMRWLTGSLNGASWAQVLPVLVALAVLGPVLLGQSKNLGMLQLGDEAAGALGVRTERTRLIAICAAVVLIAFATAASGPIAFVAFLSGPIAARLVGPGRSLLIPAALVGVVLVLAADLAGQWLFGTRFPVGVITGAAGAPYLIYLIARTNRTGGAL